MTHGMPAAPMTHSRQIPKATLADGTAVKPSIDLAHSARITADDRPAPSDCLLLFLMKA